MKRPCICITACFALGEVLACAFAESLTVPALAAFISAAVLCTALFIRSKRISVLIVTFLAFIAGAARLALDIHTMPQYDSLRELCTGTVGEYETVITDITVKGERLTLRCGGLLVYFTPEPEDSFRTGNTVLIEGDFEAMDRPRNPGEFNYYLYYRADGITHRCFADSVTVTDEHIDMVPDMLFRIRRNLLSRIDAVYDVDDAGVLRAVLLGDKSELSEDISDLYRKNGIAHLLAISGLHVGIIGMSIYNLLRKRLKLSYAICGIIAGSLTVFYCILTGAGVSTVRATVMLLLMFLAAIPGRNYDMLNCAGLTALIILAIHPYQLFNCAFLLSFACVIAIAGPYTSMAKELDIKNPLLKSLMLSLTVQLFTLPVTAYFFFEVSLYGCLLNLIVIPLMTYAVWSALAATFLTFISVHAAVMTAACSHYILKLYSWLCDTASHMPFSSILIGRPALWQICAYYCFFFSVLYLFPLKDRISASHLLMWVRETASSLTRERTSL